MTIDQLVNLPARNQDPTTFATNANAIWPQVNTFATQANALAAAMTLVAAGTAFAIPYTFSSTITDADPGNGILRLSSATQNTSTQIRVDLLGSDTADYTALIDQFGASTSTVKGNIRITKLADPTKWIDFNMTVKGSETGYRNLTGTVAASSAANPFVNGDSLVLLFDRVGDIGLTGPTGSLTRRVSTIASSATPTPNAGTDDMYTVTALAVAPTFGAPTGSPVEGQGLMMRVKDNGTARALAFNAIYRASTDLALPSTTIISKTLYMGFIYNSADVKWDLLAVLNNF